MGGAIGYGAIITNPVMNDKIEIIVSALSKFLLKKYF